MSSRRFSWLVVGGALTVATADARAQYSTTVLSDNPLAYYRLEEGTGSTTAADAAPAAGSNNGALNGGTLSFGDPGIVNGSFAATSFGPGNGRIFVPGFDKLGTGYSVEYWLRIDVMPTGCCAPLVGDGVGSNFFLMNYLIGPDQGAIGDVRPHYGFANTPVSTDSNQSLLTGLVYHVVTTWDAGDIDGNNAAIFINGVEDKRITATNNFANDGQILYLGRDDREQYNGAIFTLDEVALYDYALTPSRVAAHYAAGVPEPTALSLLAIGGIGLLTRRSRAGRA